MSNPEPQVYERVTAYTEQIRELQTTITRLETLLELQKLFTEQANKTKSVIEKRTLEKVVATLEGMN